jgi:hypothetical protein
VLPRCCVARPQKRSSVCSIGARPGITVYYRLNGEPAYHVDIAVYSDASCNTDRKTYLAKGKANSLPEHRIWEVADPEGLAETLLGKFKGGAQDQFRHVTRYLRRWNDENFDANCTARSIGITLQPKCHSRKEHVDKNHAHGGGACWAFTTGLACGWSGHHTHCQGT